MKYLTLALCIAAFSSGYKIADWRLTARANAEEVERTRVAERARDAAVTEYNLLVVAQAAERDKHAKDLRNAQNTTTLLRDGAIGLRVAATCPGIGLASTSARPGVDSGSSAELDSAARRAYFALRDGIDRVTAQLAACQAELK